MFCIFYFMNFKNFMNFLLKLKYRRIQQYHTDDNQNADYGPSHLDSFLVFFIEKHIIILSHYEEFSTEKKI